MAYTTVDKVKALFRQLKIETTNTALTPASVELWISQADAEINAKLYPFYVVPIVELASPLSFRLVEKISTLKTAHIIKTVMELKTELSDKDQEVQTNLGKLADKMLNEMIPEFNESTGRYSQALMQLPDVPVKVVSPASASLMSSNSGTVVFRKGADNW